MISVVAALALGATKCVAICQTQNYPLRETAHGYLGRYVDQPLCVDVSLSPECVAGSHVPFSDLELSRREAKSYGFDGFCSFIPTSWSNHRWFEACAESKVKDFMSVAVLQRYDPDVPAEHDAFAFAATNGLARLPDGRVLVLGYWSQGPAYWTKKGTSLETMRRWMDRYRTEFGTNFVFITDLPEAGRSSFRSEYARTGDLSKESRDYLRNLFRTTLPVVDGVSVGETHMLRRLDRETLTFTHTPGYLRIVFGILREVLDEPEMKGKLMGMVVVNGHENAYTRGYAVSHDGTRTLRGILDVAREFRPDVFKFCEWDEYNENTCFCPTLYNGYVTKRVLRDFFKEYRGEKLMPLEGDDITVPNLAVSYRKSLSPGEPLAVEVLNIADGSGSGDIQVAVRIADENDNELRRFPARTLSAERTEEARFVMSTDEATAARALRVSIAWRCAGGRTGIVREGLHAVDFAPRMSWNHKWVKLAIRDLAPMRKTEISMTNGELVANLECAEPIRHAMVTGGGEILHIHNPDDPVSRFHEDGSNAVFQVTHIAPLPPFPMKLRHYFFTLRDVSDAEWLFGRQLLNGLTYDGRWLAMSTEPVYLRVPKSVLATGKLDVDLTVGTNALIRGTLPLVAAWTNGTYVLGAPGGVQVALTRLNRQAVYPMDFGRKTCMFSVKPAADRATMAYQVQVVTMSGKEWRSRPFVVERGSRKPVLRYDFSPKAGDAVLPENGERWFTGVLGGYFSTTTCRNRGPATSGALEEGGLSPCPAGVDWRPCRAEGDAGWELVFDGVDDLVGLPWETVPQFGPWEVSFEFRPDDTERKACLFASCMLSGLGNLWGIMLEHGRIEAAYLGMLDKEGWISVASAADAVKSGVWHHLAVRHTGSVFELELDGTKKSIPSKLPGRSTSTSLLGGMPGRGFFKGSIRNLVIK